MEELIVNLHIHTVYSDGTGDHNEIGNAALQAGIDVVIVTDHNVLVQGMERFFQRDEQKTLLLVGEEVHDRPASRRKTTSWSSAQGERCRPIRQNRSG